MRTQAGGLIAVTALIASVLAHGAAGADGTGSSVPDPTSSTAVAAPTSDVSAATAPPTSAPTTNTLPTAATTNTSTTTTQPATTTTQPATPQAEGPVVADQSASRIDNPRQLVTPPEAPTTTTIPPLWALPANSGSGRRIVYSKTNQWLWAVEANGTIAKNHPVSGRRTWNQPLPGTYRVFSRSGYTCNITNPSVCWRYMVRFTVGPGGDNIGFHEIPTNTRTGNRLQGDWQLGQALSAGCVRQATPDALFIWNWAPIGTQVVVLP